MIDLKKEFYSQLNMRKSWINHGKNWIKMSDFLSFLTVNVEIVRDHLGSDMGWTRRENNEIGLIVCGGFVNRVEYLDHLEYGKNLHNPYNNLVNPFYMFDIMNKQGRDFFLKFYADDIAAIAEKQNNLVSFHGLKAEQAQATYDEIKAEVERLRNLE